MPQFAHFNPGASQPSRVLGWYDTDFADYPDLPATETLVALDPATWATRLSTPYIHDGTLVADPTPAPATPPLSITNFQCRALLMGLGLFDTVDALLRARGGVAWQAWEYANNMDRNGALVTELGTSLGFSDEQLDALFVQAAGILA